MRSRAFVIIFFLRFLAAILLGVIPALWVIQQDEKVQLFFKTKFVNMLQKDWDCNIIIEKFNINFFTGKILFKNGSISSTKDKEDYFWHFDTISVKFSRIKYFLENQLELSIIINNIKAKSVFENGSLKVNDHIKKIFSQSINLTAELKSITINNIDMLIFDKQKTLSSQNIYLKLNCQFDLRKNKNYQKSESKSGKISIYNGEILIDDKVLLNNISGENNFYKNEKSNYCWNFNINNKFTLINTEQIQNSSTNTTNNNIKITGLISDEKKQLFIKTENNNYLDLCFYNLDNKKLFLNGSFDFEILKKFFELFSIKDKIEGFCELNSQLTFDKTNNQTNNLDFDLNSKIKFNNLKINNLLIGNSKIEIKKNKDLINSKIYFNNPLPEYLLEKNSFESNISWDINNKKIDLTLNNCEPIAFKSDWSWFLTPKDFKINLSFDENFSCTGNYKLSLMGTADKNYYLDGKCKYTKNILKIMGNTDYGKILIKSVVSPEFYLEKILYVNKFNKILASLESDSNKKITGQLNCAYLKSFLPQNIKRLLLGKKANICFNLNDFNKNSLKGDIFLSSGKISFIGSYNPIEALNLNFELDLLEKKLLLDNLNIKFFRGEINSPKTIINFSKTGNLTFVHCPIILNDLLINWKRDFYGLVYGKFLLLKQPDILSENNNKNFNNFFTINGDLVLKKSLFNENFITLLDLEKNTNLINKFTDQSIELSDKDVIQININLTNEKPIKAKTAMLEADANLDLNFKTLIINNSPQEPQLVGNINIDNGILKFLHHKLYINYGKIQFFPNHLNDPMFDLVAKNRIKKYFITLQATGSALAPHVILEASPELTEEEILSLLFAGSENASLQSNLSNILIKNLTSALLNNKAILPEKNKFFKKLVLPFKYVQISPDFTNQSGRTGIKGTVSVDLNKQMHAQIQKNFSLPEDLSFQLDYFLTDDINLRAVRDQRGEIGSEIEVRFKL